MNSKTLNLPDNSSEESMDLVISYYNLATLPDIDKKQAKEMKRILELGLKNQELGEWLEDINLFLLDQLEDTTENFDYTRNESRTSLLKKLHTQHKEQFNKLKEKYNKYYDFK